MGAVFDAIFSAIAGPVLLVVGLGVLGFVFYMIGVDPEPIVSVVVALTPIWLPIALFFVTFERWMEFVNLKFAMNQGRSTLRIKLPQEVLKSPEAMEQVLAQIHNVQSPDNLWQTYIDGKHPLTFTLELVSIGGEVRFYMNVPTRKVKDATEAQLYAQYPGVEVVEEPLDYTASVPWDPERFEYMAFHMGKKENEVFPIKTYIDCGLDKLPKEEEKLDPISPMIEQLSKLQPHEQLWVQILIVPHVKRNFKRGSLSEKPSWEGKIAQKIDEIMCRDPKTKSGPGDINEQPRLTMTERDTVTAMERSMAKYAYETGIRWIYITEKGKFNGDLIAPTIRTFASYDMIKRNQIGVLWRTDFDYNWFSDFSGARKMSWKKQELADYKKRKYEQRDIKNNSDATFVLSVEELATMFHLPGQVVVTPTLPRILSTRREAPSNLPVGQPPQ